MKLFRNSLTFCFILKHKITLFQLLSFVLIRFITRCHSHSLIVFFCYSLSYVVTCCHSLPLLVLLVVTRCTTCCHSLLFIVPIVVNRCHSLSLVVPFVFTRCHSMSFCKRPRSFENCSYLSSCSLLQRWRFQRINYSNVALNQTLLLQKFRGTSPNIFYVLEAYGTHRAKACQRICKMFHQKFSKLVSAFSL